MENTILPTRNDVEELFTDKLKETYPNLADIRVTLGKYYDDCRGMEIEYYDIEYQEYTKSGRKSPNWKTLYLCSDL